MYFNCDVLKVLMKVESCETQRKAKKSPCKTCTAWQTLTTDVANLKTVEEVESFWLTEAAAKEDPVRFNHEANNERLSHLRNGKSRYERRR